MNEKFNKKIITLKIELVLDSNKQLVSFFFIKKINNSIQLLLLIIFEKNRKKIEYSK